MSKDNKTLIGNWVEERQSSSYEKDSWNEDGTLCTRLHRQGHKGIFTSELNASMETSSTVQSSYTPPSQAPPPVRTTGKRQEELTKQLYALVSQQEREERTIHPPVLDYKTVTKEDYHRDFESTQPQPIADHDIHTEQPVSYWNQNVDRITGVSQMMTLTGPFHRNAAFSTPIQEYTDKPKPHGLM